MRFIQLSDCHLLADPKQHIRKFNSHDSLHQITEHLRNIEKLANAFIFTGDLSQDGSAKSYQNLNTLLNFTQKPIYALPGNHDNALEMRKHLHAQCVQDAELGNWQILLLNSQVSGEEYGKINENDLHWLNLWLMTNTNKHILIAIHHQPIAVGSQWIDKIMLKNNELLLDILKNYNNIKGLIFGHVHQVFDQKFEHVRIMGCPSTCFQYQIKTNKFTIDKIAKPGYRWLELNNDGSLETGIVRLN